MNLKIADNLFIGYFFKENNMKKIFIKKYKEKYKSPRGSFKYYLAIFMELIGILLWIFALYEIFILKLTNPVWIIFHFAGIIFCSGSFLYAKWINHN